MTGTSLDRIELANQVDDRVERVLPAEWKRRIYRMIEGWSGPEQITARDVERWHEELTEALDEIKYEVKAGGH